MDVAVVGAGRLGTALAVLLAEAGHHIVAASGRAASRDRVERYLPDTAFVAPPDAAAAGELVLVGVPDDAIAPVVADLAAAGAFRRGAWVAHLSGAASLEVLAPVRAAGGRTLAIHPLQTVPDVARAIERLPGCTVAVTADDDEGAALGERLARDVGAEPFRLADDLRPLYHAAAVFASNDLVAAAWVAERLLREAGVPDPGRALAPLQRATLENVADLGARAALTGPAVRGDAGTVARNLEALADRAPDAVPAYVAMARVKLDLAVAAGRLAPAGRAAVEEVLATWS